MNNKCYMGHGLSAVRDTGYFVVSALTKRVMIPRGRDREFLLQDPNPTQK